MSIGKRIFRKIKSSCGPEEEIPAMFRANYRHFRQLLDANRKALEIIAEMEGTLEAIRPFGMNAVRSWCTETSTHVLHSIQNLNALAPGDYKALRQRFDEIQKNINICIHPVSPHRKGPLVLPFSEVTKEMSDAVGSKLANLGEIRKHFHWKVPNGFVITARAYECFMKHNDLQTEIDRRIQDTPSDRLDQLFHVSSSIQLLITLKGGIPDEMEKAIWKHYNILRLEEQGEVQMAIRSSALGEDIHGISFAGQYRSELNVRPENIFQAYKNVVASKYNRPAMAYRNNRGIRDEDVAMCVGCMSMVNAVSGGVVYSKNPNDPTDDSVIISSVWGLPRSVVDGTTPADFFVVTRGDTLTIEQKHIAVKERKVVRYRQEGLFRIDMTAEEARLPSLSDEQVFEIARLALELEAYFGKPRDIEWAIEKDGSLIVLQCRALQQKEASPLDTREEWVDSEPHSMILKGGVTACPGVAAGPVFVVNNDVDVLQFPQNAVLVAVQSLPRWAAVMNQAAAVVTEQGSVVGHLATVAREFGVPALFGVNGAVEGLKNGQWITVDADSLKIHKGRIDALLHRADKPKSLMEGSPVFEAFRRAAEHITPLTLSDPEGPLFKAKNCKTLHDITRFCHEKVLEEMFRFGKDYRLVKQSGKRLICDLPMSYWAINLDDGFKVEINGDTVRLENIASLPMLAFWDGLTAAPWKAPASDRPSGPTAAFLAAKMHSASEPSRGSHYAMGNYCLISKNFCVLQLRFNSHFCTVESVVGHIAADNHINFHIKRGAANLERTIFPARLVAEILEEFHFRTESKEDAFFAQLRGYDQTFTKVGLRVLGYLTMQMRQLDLDMSNSASIDHYKKVILEGLNAMVG